MPCHRAVASVSAVYGGCYGGTACTAPHGCADCSMTEAECTTAGKTWMADATQYCAEGTPAIMGCRYYSHGSGYYFDCTMGNNYEALCAAKSWGSWRVYDNVTANTGCDAKPSAELLAARLADVPPSPPFFPPPGPPPDSPPPASDLPSHSDSPPPHSDPPSLSAAARARRRLSAGHVLVQEQKECDDDGETSKGYLATLQECADECAATTGCVNFIYGRVGAGRCSGTTCKCYTVRATAPLPPPPASHAYLSSCEACVSLTAHSSRPCYGGVANTNCA